MHSGRTLNYLARDQGFKSICLSAEGDIDRKRGEGIGCGAGKMKVFVKLSFSSNGVMTDKKSSTILIYKNRDTNIYTEKVGVD